MQIYQIEDCERSGAKCYKTFYSRNLRMFVISFSVYPCQAFPVQSDVCLYSRNLPYWRTFHVLFYRVCSWPCPQTI